MNVKQSSEQCRTTIPLLQTAMSETKAADLSVHERIEQQTATIIVLKKMRENLQPARTGILLRCEQAGQFITLQQYLVRDSSAVVVQVRFYLNVFTIHIDFALYTSFVATSNCSFIRLVSCSRLNRPRIGHFPWTSLTKQQL